MRMLDHKVIYIGMVEHDPVSLYSFATDFKDRHLTVTLAKKDNLTLSFDLGT